MDRIVSMCGRFALSKTEQLLKKRFKVKDIDPGYKTSFNIAPDAAIPVILNEDTSKIILAHWGYTPHWMGKDRSFSVINARSEEITTKNFFKSSFLKRRCLILADSFYEWHKQGSLKVPHRIFLRGEECFAFAGVWDIWDDRLNCAIITTTANDLIRPIHDRMPVVLAKDSEEAWLRSDDPEELKRILCPYPSGEMDMNAVSRDVNSPKNDSEALLRNIKGIK